MPEKLPSRSFDSLIRCGESRALRMTPSYGGGTMRSFDGCSPLPFHLEGVAGEVRFLMNPAPSLCH